MFANIGDLTGNVISAEKNLPLLASQSVVLFCLEKKSNVDNFLPDFDIANSRPF